MGWRTTVVFKPLLGEQFYIKKFYAKHNHYKTEDGEYLAEEY